MKIGLALGGGGARGGAHLGVLAELAQLGIEPALITGTSVGGVVGVLYSAGYSIDEITQIVQQVSLSNIFRLPNGRPALSSNEKIEEVLRDALGTRHFAELNLPVAVVAVDLVRRKEVILDEGEVVPALLATTALPILLPPMQRSEMVLIDGGILNNTPFDVARARGATHVIAVDLTNSSSFSLEPENTPQPDHLLERVIQATLNMPTLRIASGVFDVLAAQSLNARMAISQPELLLRPDVQSIGLFDLHLWELGIKAGREAVKAATKQLEPLVTT